MCWLHVNCRGTTRECSQPFLPSLHRALCANWKGEQPLARTRGWETLTVIPATCPACYLPDGNRQGGAFGSGWSWTPLPASKTPMDWPSASPAPLSLSSVQFSRSVVYDSLQPHESQHARPPVHHQLPEFTQTQRPSSQWCHPAISS